MSLKFHTLRRDQWIARPIDEVFAFFADARNLEEITPPWLAFRIMAMESGPISEGTEIRYRLRHYIGIALPTTTASFCGRRFAISIFWIWKSILLTARSIRGSGPNGSANNTPCCNPFPASRKKPPRQFL